MAKYVSSTPFIRTGLYLGLLAASTAQAQLEEVIVTAQKRVENLQETPLAIEVLTDADIENKGVVNLVSLFSTTPGVSGFDAPSGRGNISVNIRGVAGGNSNSVSVDPASGIYIDGVFIGKAAGNGVDTMDLERIEVLKGPQGTLYGRNSTGGAINFITKKPKDEFALKLKASVGNYQTRNISGRVDLPVTDDLSMALSLYQNKRDPLYKDTRADGPGFEDINRDGGRLALLWHATDKLTMEYSYTHNALDETTNLLNPVGFNPLGAGVTSAEGYPFEVRINNLDRINAVTAARAGLASLPQVAEVQQLGVWMDNYLAWAHDIRRNASKHPSHGSSDADPYAKTDVDAHTLSLAWDAGELGAFGNVEFKSISGFRKMENEAFADIDGMNNSVDGGVIHDLTLLTIGAAFFDQLSPLAPAAYEFSVGQTLVQTILERGRAPVLDNYNAINHDQFSQEFQMVGDTDSLDYVLGLYYYKDESEFINNRDATFPLAFTETTTHELSTEAMSIYAQATWVPNEDSPWAFTGGLRLTHETKDITYLWRSSSNPLSFFVGPPAANYVSNELSQTQPIVEGIHGRSFEKDFDNLSGKFTVQYFFSDDVNAFATYSTGYRSGGFNGDFFDRENDTADAFDEETIENIELGIKSVLMGGRMQINATAFAYNYDDVQVATLLPQSNGSVTSAFTNAGAAERQGLELSVRYSPFDSLLLGFSYNRMNGHFEEYPPLTASSLDGGAVLEVVDYAERGLTPDHQVVVDVNWNIYNSETGNLDLAINGSWYDEALPVILSSAVYDTNGNRLPDTPAAFEQPSVDERTLVNARLAWTSELDAGKVTVALWAQNLLDDKYRDFAYNYGDALGLTVAQYGERRVWGMDFIWEM